VVSGQPDREAPIPFDPTNQPTADLIRFATARRDQRNLMQLTANIAVGNAEEQRRIERERLEEERRAEERLEEERRAEE
jgi:hypothetical protein